MIQPKEIYVINPNVKMDMMNPVANIFAIPVEHKFKCIQSRESGKVIYTQITKYFKESE